MSEITPEELEALLQFKSEGGNILRAVREERKKKSRVKARALLVASSKTRRAGKLVVEVQHGLTGQWVAATNMQADHINGDPFDNRIENLQWLTGEENRAKGGNKISH